MGEINFNELFKQRLNLQDYLQKTDLVAKNLIGKLLIKKSNNQYIAGIITETEAYLAENDLASHSAVGQTLRNSAMFEIGGTIYVYKIYGIHHCINVVTESEGKGAAVLIRAIQPVYGIDLMKSNRKQVKIEQLCKGPGNTAKAFSFNLSDNGINLNSENLFISPFKKINSSDIIQTKRIGISKSQHLNLRFYLKNSKFISRY